MSITTYSELQTAIASRLHRDDLSGIIPDFITLAETRINRKLRVAGFESSSNVTCVAGTQAYALPSDFLALRSVTLQGTVNRALSRLTPDSAEKYYGSTSTSKPYGYVIEGTQIKFYRTPDSDYTITLGYYAKPAALSEANPSNWTLSNCVDALLYASLAEAATHIKDSKALADWAALYDRAIDDIVEADKLDRWSGANAEVRVV